MASIFGIAATDVVRHLPIDASEITASTEPISTDDLDEFIHDGENQIAGILTKAGLDPLTIDTATTAQARAAVVAYARWKAADVMDYKGEFALAAREEWLEYITRYANAPQQLNQRVNRVKTNTPADPPVASSDFTGRGFKF